MKDYAGGSRGSRSLRKKHSKTYVDGMDSTDEEEEMLTSYDPEEKLKSKNFPPYFVHEMKGEDLTLDFFQRFGFNHPIHVPEKSGLHIRVPDSSFSITDVKNLVGGRRLLEVMNCATQLNAEMTLKDFEEFFTDPDRDDTKLNVISLEFSHTKLDGHVIAPRVVRQIDLTDIAWPRHLKDMQDESSNDLTKMYYPKVQKYCLMSIAGCYTDFHVDLGGTSVWYHVLKGLKVFWLIPPTKTNLKAFENWTFSGKQGDVFFGDMVEKCGRVVLRPGNTFFIPSGWIHAVYTPVDSLVFGGNYLHPYALQRQIRIASLEETIKVPQKFRFPFFTEMMWYTLDKYCYALLGRHHLNVDEVTLTKLLGTEEERKAFVENIGHPHITRMELTGLKAIVLYLHSLPMHKKNVPPLIKDPVSLIRDIRIIVEVHKYDRINRAVTGRPILYWPGVKKDIGWGIKGKHSHKYALEPAPRKEIDGVSILDPNSRCLICGLDGWFTQPTIEGVDRNPKCNSLMECVTCHELVHFQCVLDFGDSGETTNHSNGFWKCGDCLITPPEKEPVPTNNVHSELILKSEVVSSSQQENNIGTENIKKEPVDSVVQPDDDCNKSANNAMAVDDSSVPSKIKEEQAPEPQAVPMECDAIEPVAVKKEEINEYSRWHSKVRHFFQRHQETYGKYDFLYNMPKELIVSALLEQDFVLVPIFSYLSSFDLENCRAVCNAWYMTLKVNSGPRVVDLSGHKITPHMLNVISLKKPERIVLDWTNISKQHLNWLLPKLVSTRSLSLMGLEYTGQVSSLSSLQIGHLTSLDLSFVSNLNDMAVNKLLARLGDKKGSMLGLKRILLRHTDISDIAVRYVCQNLPQLVTLDLESCPRISDAGLAQVADQDLPAAASLNNLNVSKCGNVTDAGLAHLCRCQALRWIGISGTAITQAGIQNFIGNKDKFLHKKGVIFKQLKCDKV